MVVIPPYVPPNSYLPRCPIDYTLYQTCDGADPATPIVSPYPNRRPRRMRVPLDARVQSLLHPPHVKGDRVMSEEQKPRTPTPDDPAPRPVDVPRHYEPDPQEDEEAQTDAAPAEKPASAPAPAHTPRRTGSS